MAFTPTGVEFVAKNLSGYVRDLNIANKAQQNLGDGFQANAKTLGTGFSIAAGAGAVGLGAIVTALGAAAYSGLSFNNTLQQTTARLNAFTKDGKITADILDTIREEAAKTPFAFDEMATAAASLYPVAKQSGQSLQDLIQQAEILAAVNPEQGLEGAAFALREALSGDFVSLMERFNIPRTLINRLKDEGVPAAELVGRALKEMGLDIDLVANLGQTASGRLSTFKDTLTNIAGIVTQPLFDKGSESLGRFNQLLSDNEPLLTSMAESLASKIASSLEVYEAGLDAAIAGTESWLYVVGEAIPAIQEFNANIDTNAGKALANAQSFDELQAAMANGLGDIDAVKQALVENTSSAEDYSKQLQNLIDMSVESGAGYEYALQNLSLLDGEYESITGSIDAQNRALDINAQSMRYAGQEAYYLAQQQMATIPAIDAVTDALDRQVMAFSENRRRQTEAARYAGLATVDETTQLRATGLNINQIQGMQGLPAQMAEMAKSQETIGQAGVKAATKIQDAFETALNSLKSTIEQNIQPTLDEVWQPPEDAQNIDEAARRLATVSTAGFGSEWLMSLNEQFAGMDFWQPITAAMESGDEGTLKQAANDILMNNVTQLWDTELIKQRVRQDLEQAALKQSIVDEIAAQMAAEGINVPGFDGVAAAISEGVKTGVDDNLEGFEEVGMSTMDGILEGMKKNEGEVLEFIKTLMQDVIANAKSEVGFGSPAREFFPIGESVIQGLTRGVSTQSGQFKRAVLSEIDVKGVLGSTNLLNKNNKRIYENFVRKGLGNLGNVTADSFNKTIGDFATRLKFPIDVIKKNAGIVTQEFERVSTAISKVDYQIRIQNIGQAIGDALSFSGFGQSAAQRLGDEINQLRMFLRSGDEYTQIGNTIIDAANAQDMLNEKLIEQKNLQTDLQDLARSQSELNFLQQQIQLLDLVRQRGLNVADIFGGISFGLEASIPDLVAATNRAVQAIVGQVNQDIRTLNPSVSSPTPTVSSGGGATVQFNGPIAINNGMDLAMLQNTITQTVAGSLA